MSKKISLNPKYTTIDGASWSTTTYNGLEYHISTNKADSSVSTLQCEFTTPYDNIDVVIEIGSSSENNYDWCYVGPLDDSGTYQSNYLDRISGMINNYPKFKTVTINVAKAVIKQTEAKQLKIDKVLLIGGSSQLTLVRKMLTDVLPNATIDTCGEKDIAVALGNIVGEQIIIDSQPVQKESEEENNINEDIVVKPCNVIYNHEDDGILLMDLG